MQVSYKIILLPLIICLLSFSAYTQSNPTVKPKIGLVLSGGGAKGLAHIGVLKVLEEAGIHPDYIGGTSMGGIIGGLYAIGYSADSLDRLGRTTPWNYYLGDEIQRRNITIEEKEDLDRFVLSFPIKENKILIPSGVINGQNIENLLNKLCAPVYTIREFSEFKIPFICIATNIVTGKEVVLNSGYLPTALRSTMSIPSVFSPVDYNDQLLVDGGLVDNLPALRVKDMGADIIIGVDVGFHSYSKEELQSLLRIMEQSLFFYGEELNIKNKAICDILIIPELQKYNASSFNAADSIINIGERAARKIMPRLKALADSIRRLYPENISDQQTPSLDSIQLIDIIYNGLEKVSPKLVSGKLQISVMQKVTPADIEKAISRIYSSLYFENVTYEIQKIEKGTRLIINLKENKGGLFRVGIHYDSNNKSAILLNTTFRNILLNGSKLSINAALGDNPYFRTSLFKNNGWKPGYGVNFETNVNQMFLYKDSKKVSAINYSETKLQLFTQSIIQNSYSLGAGVEFENSFIKPIIDPVLGIAKYRNSFINYYGFLTIDSYDNAFYPSKGIKLNSELKLITSAKNYSPVAFLAAQFSFANKIFDRVNIIGHLSGGAVNGDSIPSQYMFYTGGIVENIRIGLMPFVGLDYMERSNRSALISGIDLQLRFWKNIYIILKANAGNLANHFTQLLQLDQVISGYGITLGYNSLIGPIELTTSMSGNQPRIHSFVRIGFYF